MEPLKPVTVAGDEVRFDKRILDLRCFTDRDKVENPLWWNEEPETMNPLELETTEEDV